jgi:prostaglandin-endoperoxide synthase 2
MVMRDRSRDGFSNRAETYFLSHFPRLWRGIMAVPPLRRLANKLIISRAAQRAPSRPLPFSSMPIKGDSANLIARYTSWESLTDRDWFARHLPCKDLPSNPEINSMASLFKVRAEGPVLSDDGTVLFLSFAQWFTDGFLITDADDGRRTPTSHQIDLSPVYGLHRSETRTLRVNSEARGQRGKLKTERVNGEIYAPKLFDENKLFFKDKLFDEDAAVKSEFASLRPPSSFKKNRQRVTLERAAELAKTTFAFGSERANVTPFMAALNTLFLREHNRLAGMLEVANPSWDDERVFQTARNINIVLLIKIVVEEYINHISPYHFQLSADPSVSWRAVWNRPNWIPIEFNLLYRWHSMTPDRFVIGDQSVPVLDTLQNNTYLTERGLAATLVSASRQRSWQLGLFNTAEFLIQFQVELEAIRQSRKNCIASYNDYRAAVGYPRVSRFEQITGDQRKIDALRGLYADVDNIEYTVGLLAEDVGPRAAVPPLIGRMVALDAFSQALTNPLLSAPVFNERTFTEEGMRTIAATHCLQDVVNRNLSPGQQPVSISMTYREEER